MLTLLEGSACTFDGIKYVRSGPTDRVILGLEGECWSQLNAGNLVQRVKSSSKLPFN